MKDETNGVAITEFVGLKPKMYSYITDDGKEARRAKGVQRAVVENKLCHADYLKELNNPAENLLTNRRFESDGHQLVTIAQQKRALSAYDDKRYILDHGIHTAAYGHRAFLDRLADQVLLDQELDEAEDDNGEGAPPKEAPPPPPVTLEERRARAYAEMIGWGATAELAQMTADLEND